MLNFLSEVDWRFLLILLLVAMGFLLGAAYLAACAGAERWLTLREWLSPWKHKEKDK